MEEYIYCPGCGVRNSMSGLLSRQGVCFRCKVTVRTMKEVKDMELQSMRIAMTNNELGQTLSTMVLLQKHGVLGLDNIRAAMESEQRCRRVEEEAKKAKMERWDTVHILKDWISTEAIANALVEELEWRGRKPTIDSAKELWCQCLVHINGFMRDNLL